MEPSAHLKHLIKPCSVCGRHIDGMGNLMQVRIPTQHLSISHFHVLHDWYGREWHRVALSPADGYLALRLPRYSLGGRHLQVRNGATWGSDLFSRSSLSLRGRRSGLLTNVWRPPVACHRFRPIHLLFVLTSERPRHMETHRFATDGKIRMHFFAPFWRNKTRSEIQSASLDQSSRPAPPSLTPATPKHSYHLLLPGSILIEISWTLNCDWQ